MAHMRSHISGWWTNNHCNCCLLYYLSLRRILPPQPRVWTILSPRCNPLPLCYLTSLLTSPLTPDLPFTRVTQPLILRELHLAIPAWAQNPSRLQRLVVFSVTPQAISVSTAPSMSVPAVANGLLVIHNTAVSEIIAPSVGVLPTWPITVPIGVAPSVTLLITFSLTVLLQRTQAQVSSSMREIPRGFDVVPVVQVFNGGIVTVRGHGLVLSIVHLPLLTVGSPFMFTILIIFLTNTFRYIVW